VILDTKLIWYAWNLKCRMSPSEHRNWSERMATVKLRTSMDDICRAMGLYCRIDDIPHTAMLDATLCMNLIQEMDKRGMVRDVFGLSLAELETAGSNPAEETA